MFTAIFRGLFPPHCLSCSAPGQWVCKPCQQRYLVRSPPECCVCRKISRGFATHKTCKTNSRLKRMIVGWRYGPLARKIMMAFKEKLAYSIGQELADLLIEREISTSRNTILTPVPSDKFRLNERGYNQSEILTRHLGDILGLQTATLLLRNPGEHQTGRSAEERKRLSSEVFYPNSETIRRVNPTFPIMLIDDVCTTGTTLERCATALNAQGFKDISAIVLFRGKPVRSQLKTTRGARVA